MFSNLQWIKSLALAAVTLFVVAAQVVAQTPEGTVITNVATVTFTDANANAYASVQGSVSVTVGFQSGVTATANTPAPTPASPSSADTLNFTVANSSNGTDSVLITQNISVAGVITVTGYRYLATTYASLATLNAALAGAPIAQGGTITLKVVYDVAAGKGGVNTVYTLTAASRRVPATTSSAASSITPAQTFSVSVTPHSGTNVQKLPGSAYAFAFTVQNTGNGLDNFDLISTSPGSAVIGVISVNGVGGDSARISLAAGATQSITVIYSVANVANGSLDTLDLLGRSVALPAQTDLGVLGLQVIKPVIALTKAAYLDDGVTPVSSTVLPGQVIRYRITVNNSGGTNAASVQVTDTLPAVLTYVSTSSTVGWALSVVGHVITANYTGSGAILAASSSAMFEVRVSIN